MDPSNLPQSQLGIMGPAPGMLPPGLRNPVPNPYGVPYLTPGNPMFNPLAAAVAVNTFRQVTAMPWTASMYINPQMLPGYRQPHPSLSYGYQRFPGPMGAPGYQHDVYGGGGDSYGQPGPYDYQGNTGTMLLCRPYVLDEIIVFF